MSQSHEIAIVQVSAIQQETVQLADVLGRVPTRELVEVLDLDPRWTVVVQGREYQRTVTHQVAMHVHVGEDGAVRLERQITADASSGEVERVRLKLEQILEEARQQYDLAFNELVAEALVRALPESVRAMGAEITETHLSRQEGILELVLEVNNI